MLIYYTNTQQMEEFRLPSIFTSGGYTVYFWSNENNAGRIPSKDLNVLMELISAHYFVICAKWKEFFNVDTIRFYC